MSETHRMLLMLALLIVWSPSFLFLKMALTSLPPLTITAARVILGALFVTTMLYVRGGRLPPIGKLFTKLWLQASLMAIFMTVVPFSLFCYASQSIDSAMVALLNGTIPIFTAIFARMFFVDDRLTAYKATGIGLSTVGLLVLLLPYLQDGVNTTFEGVLSATIAALFYAIGHIWGKMYLSQLRPYLAPALQLIMSSLFLIPLALYFEAPLSLELPTAASLVGVVGLAISSTALGLIIYYKLLEQSGPTAVSTVACFLPVTGMLLGVIFLDESITFSGMIATLFMLSGLFMVNDFLPLPRIKARSSGS